MVAHVGYEEYCDRVQYGRYKKTAVRSASNMEKNCTEKVTPYYLSPIYDRGIVARVPNVEYCRAPILSTWFFSRNKEYWFLFVRSARYKYIYSSPNIYQQSNRVIRWYWIIGIELNSNDPMVLSVFDCSANINIEDYLKKMVENVGSGNCAQENPVGVLLWEPKGWICFYIFKVWIE